MKIRQTKEELDNHLKEQLNFLQSSCDSYDQGNHAEGKRIASTLRTLLHDTNNSTSLTKHLQIKHQPFLSTCSQFSEDPRIKISKKGLISVFIGDGGEDFFVPLDKAPEKKELAFDTWWNECILIDQNGNRFSRKDIVLNIANNDGGSHVDEELRPEYADLSRNNSLGNMTHKYSKWIALKTPELASVRQIGHEVLKTLINGYSKQPVNRGNGFIIGEITLGFADAIPRKHQKFGRNDPCPCGKPKKYKKCCGKV